jgi:hypothetical protein
MRPRAEPSLPVGGMAEAKPLSLVVIVGVLVEFIVDEVLPILLHVPAVLLPVFASLFALFLTQPGYSALLQACESARRLLGRRCLSDVVTTATGTIPVVKRHCMPRSGDVLG